MAEHQLIIEKHAVSPYLLPQHKMEARIVSALINFAVNVLILGVIAHWIMNNFVHSYREEVVKIRELLDRIFVPMLDFIRGIIKPITLSDGRVADFSHLILIVALAIGRRLLFFIF